MSPLRNFLAAFLTGLVLTTSTMPYLYRHHGMAGDDDGASTQEGCRFTQRQHEHDDAASGQSRSDKTEGGPDCSLLHQ